MVESPICPLANYYQFFREEVIFALHNKGMFVLLYDERNPAFMRQSKQGRNPLLDYGHSCKPLFQTANATASVL